QQPRHRQCADPDHGDFGGGFFFHQSGPVDCGRLGSQAPIDPPEHRWSTGGADPEHARDRSTVRKHWWTRPSPPAAKTASAREPGPGAPLRVAGATAAMMAISTGAGKPAPWFCERSLAPLGHTATTKPRRAIITRSYNLLICPAVFALGRRTRLSSPTF